MFVLCGVVWCIVCVSVCVRVRACVRGWVWVGGWARARALAVCAVVRTGRSLARTGRKNAFFRQGVDSNRLKGSTYFRNWRSSSTRAHACVYTHSNRLQYTSTDPNRLEQTRADSNRLEQARTGPEGSAATRRRGGAANGVAQRPGRPLRRPAASAAGEWLQAQARHGEPVENSRRKFDGRSRPTELISG